MHSLDLHQSKRKTASRLDALRLITMANSDIESSFYDEATDYQLEDDGNDDRVLAQPGIGACHGEPLADDSHVPEKENVEVNDPDGVLHKLLRHDLRGESKFMNGEYQYLLGIAAHCLPIFVSNHLKPISKALKMYNV